MLSVERSPIRRLCLSVFVRKQHAYNRISIQKALEGGDRAGRH